MKDGFRYRLSKSQKSEIAQNLIDILRKDSVITKQTRTFIINWIRSDWKEKSKVFFDVWDIVLKNYLPATRPILFRSCERIGKEGKIVSFTGRFECVRRFSKGKGMLIICDTRGALEFEEELYNAGEYEHTFYPLVHVLIKARELGGCGFSEEFLNDYIGEDEYIMKIDFGDLAALKWIK